MHPGDTISSGGTGYGAERGYPPLGKGSGAWLGFAPGSEVQVRVGISYVSLANARANLQQEIPAGTTPSQARTPTRPGTTR